MNKPGKRRGVQTKPGQEPLQAALSRTSSKPLSMRLRLIHLADLIKMAMPFYLNLFHLSLGDMTALHFRAEDPRMKTFLLWMQEGDEPYGEQDEKTIHVHSF